jgi:hypothetical protein
MTSPPRHLSICRAEGDIEGIRLVIDQVSTLITLLTIESIDLDHQLSSTQQSSQSNSQTTQLTTKPNPTKHLHHIPTMSDQQQQPSLIGGHAQYVKGAAEVRSLPISPSKSNPIHL